MGIAYLNMRGFMRAMFIMLCAMMILPELTHAKHARVTRHYKFNVCVMHFIDMFFNAERCFQFNFTYDNFFTFTD